MHSEMFHWLTKTKANKLDLFQIWINLPAKSKMTKPDDEMIWSEAVPEIKGRSRSKGNHGLME